MAIPAYKHFSYNLELMEKASEDGNWKAFFMAKKGIDRAVEQMKKESEV